MKFNIPKEYSHWAYRRENDCYLAEIRRGLGDTEADGWRVIAKRPLGCLIPHEILLFEGEVTFRGHRYSVLILEARYYHHGNQIYKVDRLHAEMDEITYPDEPLDIEKIVLRLNWGIDRTEAEMEQCKQWLLEYQAANQLSLKELDDICFQNSVWVFDQIFG